MNLFRWLAPKKARILADAERTLLEPDDVHGVGPLAEALWISRGEMHRQIERALVRLLPRLRPTDAGLLNGEQRNCLHRALHGSNTDLILAVLKALESVGDDAACPHVQRLIVMKAETPEAKRIKQAARECMSYLMRSVGTLHLARTLLRSSVVPSVPADALRQALRQVTPGDWNQGQHRG